MKRISFEVFRGIYPSPFSLQTLMSLLDESRTSKSVLYAVDAPIVYSHNEYVQILCAQFHNHLMGFALVNPNDTDTVEILDKAVNEQGLSGLKLHPPLQMSFPND